MNSGINLVIKRTDPQQGKIQKQNRIIRIIGYGFLVVFTLFSIILFIFLQTSPLPSLREKEESLSQTLNTQNEKIQSEVLISRQLTNIDEVMKKRSQLPDVVESFLSVVPPTVSIFSYQSIDGFIEMTAQSSSLSDLEIFFDRVVDLSEKGDIYQQVIISDISLTSAGRYSFGISIAE